jgi:hypothetical protein
VVARGTRLGMAHRLVVRRGASLALRAHVLTVERQPPTKPQSLVILPLTLSYARVGVYG